MHTSASRPPVRQVLGAVMRARRDDQLDDLGVPGGSAALDELHPRELLERARHELLRQCHQTQLKQLAGSVAGHRSQFPVLIAGDFNVGGPASGDERLAHEADPSGHPYGGNPGYDFMMNYFAQPRDLWLEAHPHARDADDGFSYDAVTNHLAYDAYRERIDYLLAPEHPVCKKSGPYDVRVRQMELVRWRTPEGSEISDHCGGGHERGRGGC
jgi:hypothetical protein